MAPRKKARGRDPFLEPGLEAVTRRARKPAPSAKKPTPSARPRAFEAKAARRATSRGASEAQAAAGPGRSRSAEAAAARRSVSRRTAAGSEAAQAAAGTGRNRAFEARAATQTPSVKYNKPFVLGDTGVTGRRIKPTVRRPVEGTGVTRKKTVRNRRTDTPYVMGDNGMTRRPPTPFVPYDEAGNLAGPEFTPAQIKAERMKAHRAMLKRQGIGRRFVTD